MDLFDILLQIGLVTSALVLYLIVAKARTSSGKSLYSRPGWNYPLKLFVARYAVKRWKSRKRQAGINELPRSDMAAGSDSQTVRAASPDGTSVLLVLRKLCTRPPLAEVAVHVQLPDGTSYKLPNHPTTIVGLWEGSVWNAGGLKMEVLEPLRRMRITYHGLLVRTDTNTTHYATLSLLWSTASEVLSYPEDWSVELGAQAMALDPWRNGEWPNMLDTWTEGGWSQWGSVQGGLEVDGASARVRARGVRRRHWTCQGGPAQRRQVSLLVTAADGTAVHLRAHSYRKALTQILIGNVRLPNSKVEAITSTDLDMEQFCEVKGVLPRIFSVNISTKSKNLRVIINMGEESGRLWSGATCRHEVVLVAPRAEVNGEVAGAFLELTYESANAVESVVHVSPSLRLRWLSVEEVEGMDEGVGEVEGEGLCAEFGSPAAQCPALVGGKGASLSLLASVQKEQGYVVPPGFCLTTRALEMHVKYNPALMLAIREIEKANENYIEQNFKEKCQCTVALFSNTVINDKLKEDIVNHLHDLRQRAVEMLKTKEIRFAVRSSAVGEDGEALSAAGQNETVLGCETDGDVLRAVLTCWGSMFSFTSAHYRRQNGQPCWSGAGVVVQALVSPRAAGVMLTRHPGRGSARLLLAANYGLGESVVSGAVEPDSFEISRDAWGKLSLTGTVLGSKRRLVTAGERGVMTVDVPDEIRRTACLTREEALRLAGVGARQEELWGAPRDIEWAIDKDNIYLLQARPITSLDRWTEDELLHEMDTPIMSDDELLTFANTGEVMPKPITPMTAELVVDALAQSGNQILGLTKEQIHQRQLFITHNRVTLSSYNTLYRMMPAKMNAMLRMSEMTLHGHAVADERIQGIALRRQLPNLVETIQMYIGMIKSLYYSKSHEPSARRYVENMTIDKFETDDIFELLKSVGKSKDDIIVMARHHSEASMASSVAQMLSMGVLMEGASEWKPVHWRDMEAMSTANTCAESALVPAALAAIARGVAESARAAEFRALPPGDGLVWLRRNLPHVHLDVLMFLEAHGHRCSMEFDLATLPWAMQPDSLIQLLQMMPAPNNVNQERKTNKEIIASLITPKKAVTKTFLRWLLPLCRRMVGSREGTKAQLVLAVHKVRVALRRLARVMVKEWMLPDEELVFYFTLYELRRFVETRDAALLKKATHRRQCFSKWGELQFAEMQEGWPFPSSSAPTSLPPSGDSLQATPVCGGQVVARACVIRNLTEIGELQQGDILVTHSTDIGWSPYFPMLSGIVTELGGIISHGAVIARECGLPCVVGATRATSLFQTGDLLRLDALTGVVARLVPTPAPSALSAPPPTPLPPSLPPPSSPTSLASVTIP